MVARVKYLGQDRSDIANAVKELSKDMCTPTEAGMQKIKRLGRYLKNHPRFVLQFKYQDAVNNITVWTDTGLCRVCQDQEINIRWGGAVGAAYY